MHCFTEFSFFSITLLFIFSFLIKVIITSPANEYLHVIHESRDKDLSGWRKGDRIDGDLMLFIRIALKESNMDKMYEYVMQVSDPSSNQYGKHWTPNRIVKTFAPSTDTKQNVIQWLIDFGISFDRIRFDHGSGGWIAFEAKAKDVESLLKTEYHSWLNENSMKKTIGVSYNYSVPEHIREHVDFIHPTLHFGLERGYSINQHTLNKPTPEKRIRKRTSDYPSSTQAQLKECDRYMTPDCLRALYKIPTLPNSIKVNPKNSLGILEFSSQTYLPSDLDLFFSNYSINQKYKRPKLISIDGGALNESSKQFGYIGESNMDLSYSMTLVNPIPVTLYQVGNWTSEGTNNIFLHALDLTYCLGDNGNQSVSNDGLALKSDDCGNSPLTKVISTSNGIDEVNLYPSFLYRQCNEFAKLALLGTTIVSALSDHGVAGSFDTCYDSKTRFNNAKIGRFVPSFPATCPYVLSVGATMIEPEKTYNDPESGWQVFRKNNTKISSSGGGFSDVFGIPDFQRLAIENYYKHNKPPYSSEQYNDSQTSRGIPDISANGEHFWITVDGKFTYNAGTSASVPVVASIITLINEERLNRGLSTVGFVNPALYANPSMFNDIKNGSNPGCGTNGFSAVDGWDPMTGNGTPNYSKMLEYFLNLK